MKHFRISIAFMLLIIMVNSNNLVSQESVYYPNGNPEKWNVQLTPFLWLPWINGELESVFLDESFGVPVADILGNLKGAFMINAEVSKGKFFASPGYIYTKLGTEEVKESRVGPQGNSITITATPELKMNIVTFIIGMHNPVKQKLIFDPYIGFRYNNFNTAIEVDGIMDTTSVEEKADFWDPVIGFRTLYFPHPRVPTMLKFDVGGFGIGSDFSWTATITGGYSISPQIDLIAGFSAYGTEFIGETKTGSTAGLKVFMYGFDLGMKIILPKRYKDPAIFKKVKK